MYVDESAPSGSGGGWAVDPDQVKVFADTVAEVRRHLDTVTREVEDLSTPDYAPMLGTSPTGQELAEKFADRMGSETGLRGQLNVAVAHMEEFVRAAEHTAGTYLQVDADNATKNRYI
ncbi:MAG: hypothetical protein WBA97_15485 [Actinophytocola sp.]|uniref:hypothetical protein n=1 Tax=Actinophytocola sp. TaxID=1872138 RepID=UPI003C732FDC